VRTAGHIMTSLAELARGRRGQALEAARRAEALDSLRGLETRALIATAPFLATDSAESRSLHAALARRVAREAAAPPPESFFLPDADRIRPVFHRYLLGLLSAGLGDTAASLGWARELERAGSPPSDPSLARDLALAVRAETDRVAGRTGAALESLLQMREPPRYQLVLPAPFDPRVRERFVKARLLEEGQRLGEARALYLMMGRRSMYDLPYQAPALFRLAALLERQGDSAGGKRFARRAVELWRRADPVLQPEVMPGPGPQSPPLGEPRP
jgi:hypothetical protein